MLRLLAVCCSIGLSCLSLAAAGTEALSPHLSRAAISKPANPPTKTRIAIIIDDIGYHRARGKAVALLPGAVTLAVIPHSPHGAFLAKLGHSHDKEIMLHIPMSNLLDKPLDAGALTADMPYGMFMQTLLGNIQSIPHVRGVNNHMGSLLTQQEQPMRWLMQALKSRELYFIDSRTTADSVALQIANETQLPSLSRDYFLDNEQNLTHIAAQFANFLAMAKRNGQGIAIAHPYPETVQFLRSTLPLLVLSGVQLVPVSDLLSPPNGDIFKRHRSLQSPNDGPLDYVAPYRPR